jgi:hypothetical protein
MPDNVATVVSYFDQVLAMDQAAMNRLPYDVLGLVLLWAPDGQLTLEGTPDFGSHVYNGQAELTQFYTDRQNGQADTFSMDNKASPTPLATGPDDVQATGYRHLVNHSGEGFKISYTHNFHFRPDGKIQSLHVQVGPPEPTDLAPIGSLTMQDMGRLSVVAWMVA